MNFLGAILFSVVFSSLPAHAEKGCREDRLVKVSVEKATFSGKVCWKDRYFVVGYKIPRDTVMYYKDPHVEIGYRGLNGSFIAKRKLALNAGFDSLWCRTLGYQHGFFEIEGESLTKRTLLRPRYGVGNEVVSLESVGSHQGEYSEGIYCSNEAFSMIALSIAKAREDGTLSRNFEMNLPKPIVLKRQK